MASVTVTDDYRPSLKSAKFRNTGIRGTWGVICFINAASNNYEVMTTSKMLLWSFWLFNQPNYFINMRRNFS